MIQEKMGASSYAEILQRIEAAKNEWDVVAGMVLVRSAGGFVATLAGHSA